MLMHKLSKPIYDDILSGNTTLKEAIAELEKNIILRALATSYTMVDASKKLGMHRPTLIEKCKSKGISYRDLLLVKW